ncbi:MAG TPA: hypothetical protein VNZ26_25810 [Vicinamibacterales bacterium]|nr:hypothetical protein [Vicinamibacterales bacterium]
MNESSRGSGNMLALRFVVILATALLSASKALAGEHYAVIVTGASGGEVYAQRYDKWRASFEAILRDKFGYGPESVFVFGDAQGPGVVRATRENLQHVFADLRKRVTKDDQLLVLLIGHGTSLDGEEAKFNLVGPDLSATEWAELLKTIPGRLVFIDTSGASFPFLRKLAGRGRVVLTATDSVAQRFETVFPEYFIKAFDDPAADLDKNGRVSIWEAFSYASAGVRQWFEQKGQLATERPLLDDTGAGVGREAQNPGSDGAVAKVTFLEPDPVLALPDDTALASLVKRRAELDRQLDELKARKETMSPEQYAAELEKLLIEIARVSVQIRTKS